MGFVVTGAVVLVGAGAMVSVAAGATGADVLVAAGATGADVLVACGAAGAVVAVGVALLEQEASAKLSTHMRVMSFIMLLFIRFSSKKKLYTSDLSWFFILGKIMNIL